MRHQFSANVKNKFTKEEVADLMGHDSIESAPKDYASRKKGHPEFRQYRIASTQPPDAHPADSGNSNATSPTEGDTREVEN